MRNVIEMKKIPPDQDNDLNIVYFCLEINKLLGLLGSSEGFFYSELMFV